MAFARSGKQGPPLRPPPLYDEAMIANASLPEGEFMAVVCAAATGVRVRKPGPIPSDSNMGWSPPLVKLNATINVLPDPVTSAVGRQYFALADGSGYVPVHTTNGKDLFLGHVSVQMGNLDEADIPGAVGAAVARNPPVCCTAMRRLERQPLR